MLIATYVRQQKLYSIFSRIIAGTVIVFDEYWNYPGWRQHEHLAFEEFKAKTGIVSEAIGFVPQPPASRLCDNEELELLHR